MGYLILSLLAAAIIYQVLAFAVQYWPVLVAILAGAALVWFLRRVDRLPAQVPADLRSRATTSSDFVRLLAKSVGDYEKKSASFSAMTSLRKQQAQPLESFQELANQAYSGKLLHFIGVVRDVDRHGARFKVHITPDGDTKLFGK